MASRDYSDSEDDLESRDPLDSIADNQNEGIERQPASGSGKPTSSGLRIKFRHPKAPSHERSSLSPPPPLTLKFGLPPSGPSTAKSSKAERAAYSSSDDDEPAPSAPVSRTSSAKPKKPRASRAKKRPLEAPTASLEPPVGQAAGRKSYDWLIPSFAGASHQGPTGREKEEPARKIQKLSESHEDDGPLGVLEPLPAQERERKRSHKKKKDHDVPGPGKAWRKGLKKGVQRPPREIGIETPMGSTPGNSRPGSPEGTPEEEEARTIDIPVQMVTPQDGPFVLADPEQMGIPVFSKPIVAPKMILSNFPKVTPYFLPNNGGDSGPFPRREKTRSWKNTERTFVGIGGGTLKFKSWIKGPSGDLTHVLKAEKDVQDIKAKANKENADSRLKLGKDKDGAEIKPKAPKDTEGKPRAPKDKDESKPKAPKEEKAKARTIAIAPRPSSISSPRQYKEASGELATPPIPDYLTMEQTHGQQYSTYNLHEAAARQDIIMRQHLDDLATRHQAELRRAREFGQLKGSAADQAMSRSSSRQSMDLAREQSGMTPTRDRAAEDNAQTFIHHDHNTPKGAKIGKQSKATPGKLFATTPLAGTTSQGKPSRRSATPRSQSPVKHTSGQVTASLPHEVFVERLPDTTMPSVLEPASDRSYAPEVTTSIPIPGPRGASYPSPTRGLMPLHGDLDVGESNTPAKTPRRSKLAHEIQAESEIRA